LDELAAAVKGALAAKSVEKDRLAQFGVEKQRLISRLLPIDVDVNWADLHAMAVEDYVTQRDPEAAKNLCVVLELEFMATEAVQSETHRLRELHLVLEDRVPPIKIRPQKRDRQKKRGQKTGSKVPKQGQVSQTEHSQQHRAPQGEGWRWQKSLKKRDETVAFSSAGV